MTTATAIPEGIHRAAPREIIEERFRTLMYATVHPDWDDEKLIGGNSKLWYRFDRALTSLVYDLFQHDLEGVVEGIVSDLHETIRRESIRLVLDDGTAEWAGRYERVEAAS